MHTQLSQVEISDLPNFIIIPEQHYLVSGQWQSSIVLQNSATRDQKVLNFLFVTKLLLSISKEIGEHYIKKTCLADDMFGSQPGDISNNSTFYTGA